MFKKLISLIIYLSLLPQTVSAFHISGEASIIICADTNQVIYGENIHEKLGMASTTKIMTAIIALEQKNTSDIITISQNASRQEGSSIYLKPDDKVTLLDLLYGLMLNSGNDAAMAIAEYVSGNPDEFTLLMNEKAAELGMKNTHFENPSGLPDNDHYSSAYDMAILMSYAMKNAEFRRITNTKEHQINTGDSVTYLRNHNKLLWQYPYAIGGKTGFTKASGRCFVSSAEKDGVTLVAVTLNAPNDWNDHEQLLDFGFEKAKPTKILSKNDILCSKKISDMRVNLLSEQDFYIPLKDEKKHCVTCKVRLKKSIDEEIKYGTILGIGEIYVGDYHVANINLISGQNVSKMNGVRFSRTLWQIFKTTLL